MTRRAASRGVLIVGVVLVLLSGAGCGADVPVYGACEGSAECGGGSDGCYDVTVQRDDGSTGRASFCSAACAAHEDCPGDGACLALEAEPEVQLCWQRCERTADCGSPLFCTAVSGAAGVSRVCMP